MPGFLLHQGATVMCIHAGQAQPTAPNPRVKVSGQPTVTVAAPYAVAGCMLPALSAGVLPPCVTAQWVTAAIRVRSSGQALVLFDSQAICTPTGTPLNIVVTQMRVRGT